MKLNKILSTALVMVMLLSSIMTVIPMSAFAAESEGVKVTMGEADILKNSPDTLTTLVSNWLNHNYSTAEEMLADQIKSGELDTIEAGDFALYINRYTGFVFYENRKTGQILTSNPIDPASNNNMQLPLDVMSQIDIQYIDEKNPTVDSDTHYYTMQQIKEGFAIKLSEIAELPDGRKGISVQYTMGVNPADFRVPRYITTTDFAENLAKPMFRKVAEVMLQHCGETGTDYDLSDNTSLLLGERYLLSKITTALDSLLAFAAEKIGIKSEGYGIIKKYIQGTKTLFSAYTMLINKKNLDSNSILLTEVPILNEGVSVLTLDDYSLPTFKLANDAIASVLGDAYTKESAKEDLAKTGYVKNDVVNNASFLISINYTLNEKGELYFEVPMSAPYFVNNNSNYSIKSITPLKYFGSGDIYKDGYIFFPDGSGTIVNYDNINEIQANYYSSTYGNDYGYASLTPSKAHIEQATMPIYGQVCEVAANAKTREITGEETITNGFFAIIEEGSSLMDITFTSTSGSHKHASTAARYAPHPMDQRDLSQSLSAGIKGKYYIVSNSRYEGTYKTKITMLVDEKLADYVPDSYAPNYVGMANCYRHYLIQKGVLSQLAESETKKALPLYIETLGAMDVTQRILSFPVVVSTPLTTFDNIATMYSELSALGVKNINFRLNGFANGGMVSTYPVNVKWQDSLGGKDGLNKLLSYADETNKKVDQGYNLGVYPDFDFLYIYKTDFFNGVNYSGTAAIMVDNRYASKQSFNAILQVYESIYAMVVSADSYDELYERFNKEYSKYGLDTLSVATLGAELNSNFDLENAINRETSLKYVDRLLSKMSDDYSVMTDVGNVYAWKYADHILNAPIDSSHYKYSSYTIPFYGMVLHGYVNYAGSPLNYSGTADYDILRSIESGASLQYILCYDNSNYLKADPNLSKYYGVDYKNWKDIIAEQYAKLNSAIGDLQNDVITDHRVLISERVVSRAEVVSNYATLIDEFVENADVVFERIVSDTATELRENGGFAGYTSLWANIDEQSLVRKMVSILNTTEAKAKLYVLSKAELEVLGVRETDGSMSLYQAIQYRANVLADKFARSYPKTQNPYEIALSASDVQYKSRYVYETNSYATDKNYATTSYTRDNDNVVMVTYTDPVTGEQTMFFINYNTYAVKVKLDPEVYTGIADLIDDKGYFTLEGTNYIKVK